MKRHVLFGFVMLCLAGVATADGVAPAYVSAAAADSACPAADTANDKDCKPTELIVFAGSSC